MGAGSAKDDPLYFGTPAEFRAWLTEHHATAREVYVGFHRRHTKRPSMTWQESVAVALCFGWVDGVIQPLGGDRYSRRFTPRRKGSVWSAVNIAMVGRLEAEGRMTDAGRAEFAKRTEKRSAIYGYEQKARPPELDAASLRALRKNRKAWAFYETLPPSQRKKMAWWVTSAKKPETRAARLAKLIQACADGVRL